MNIIKRIRIVLIGAMTIYSAKSHSQDISFVVSFSQPQAHYADVEMSLSNLKSNYVDVKMPVWTPGSYLIREFARNVEGFKVTGDGGKSLPFQKISKNTWRIITPNVKKVTVSYSVYSFEVSVRTNFVDDSHAFLSPAGTFMYPADAINQPSTVTIKPFKGWNKISTGLEPVTGKANTYYAPDFNVLFDSPIEIGNHDIFSFQAAGVKHEVAMYGGGNYDKALLKDHMSKIVEEETSVFGENPNKRYVFIVHNRSSGGGGLEHLNSTVLGASRNGYANEKSYKGFLGLVAHEYFHLWNVKRLRPQALGPFDYEQENYTTDLWISEGFTAYYDNLIMKRTGLYSTEEYLNILAKDLTALKNQPGNSIQSVAEASFDAWIKYYRPNENSPNSTVSYYTKGAVVGMIIDLEIMNATGGKKNLDDVLKQMYNLYYKELGRGFTDAEFRDMVEKVAGKSISDIYKNYVNGVAPINYQKYLAYAGMEIVDENAGKSEPYLGVATLIREGKVVVTGVARNSAAWIDGINVNDELVSVNGVRLTPEKNGATEIQQLISAAKVGQKLNIEVVRDGLVRNLEITLLKNRSVSYTIVPMKTASQKQQQIRKKWLRN